ncbi:hypothetical protein PGB90_006811 [Kerria lacca]
MPNFDSANKNSLKTKLPSSSTYNFAISVGNVTFIVQYCPRVLRIDNALFNGGNSKSNLWCCSFWSYEHQISSPKERICLITTVVVFSTPSAVKKIEISTLYKKNFFFFLYSIKKKIINV